MDELLAQVDSGPLVDEAEGLRRQDRGERDAFDPPAVALLRDLPGDAQEHVPHEDRAAGEPGQGGRLVVRACGGRAVQIAHQQVADPARHGQDRRRVLVRLEALVAAVALDAREAGDLAPGYRLAGVDHAEPYGRDRPHRFDGLQQGHVQLVVDPGDGGPYPVGEGWVGDQDGPRLDHMGAGQDQPVGEQDAAALLDRGDDHRAVGGVDDGRARQGRRAHGRTSPSPEPAGPSPRRSRHRIPPWTRRPPSRSPRPRPSRCCAGSG